MLARLLDWLLYGAWLIYLLAGAWTTPKTWVNNDPLTAGDMNTHIRDNLNALKAPPSGHYLANEASDLGLTSTTFADVDATSGKFSHTITSTGGKIFVGINLTAVQSTGNAFFDITIDGARYGGDDGLLIFTSTNPNPVTGCFMLSGISAGSRTINLVYKVSAGTLTIYRGAGTANRDVHPQFWVSEGM